MKAVILAAGSATRLRPLTDDMPKALLPVNEKCIIQYAIDSLESHGVIDFIVVTGYRHEKIESFLYNHYPKLNFSFIRNEQYEKTNNIYSLWLALSYSEPEDIILLDSDIVFEDKLIGRILDFPYKNVVAVVKHPLGDEEMKVQIGRNGLISEISKTAKAESAIGESIGIEKFSKKYVDSLRSELDKMIHTEGLCNEFYELAFTRLAQNGKYLNYIDISNYFAMEIDTIEDYYLCQTTCVSTQSCGRL